MTNNSQNNPACIDVSTENLLKTAKLARLQLKESEVEQFRQQIAEACQNFEKINEVNCDGVNPLMSPLEEESSQRVDEVTNDKVTDAVLDQAPELQGRLFRVPPVV
ncbi:MAG: Asp-tRNA(Asn)/Glu-tRNA(Gln) amidotransferase subunit GatC [Pseudomonadota bacterium]